MLKNYLAGQDRLPIAREPMESPPWHLKPLQLDTSLAARVNKQDTPAAAIKAEALCLIDKYAATTLIYTDASKLPSGEASAAFYVPSAKHTHCAKMNSLVSIHSAEVAAVQLAVD